MSKILGRPKSAEPPQPSVDKEVPFSEYYCETSARLRCLNCDEVPAGSGKAGIAAPGKWVPFPEIHEVLGGSRRKIYGADGQVTYGAPKLAVLPVLPPIPKSSTTTTTVTTTTTTEVTKWSPFSGLYYVPII